VRDKFRFVGEMAPKKKSWKSNPKSVGVKKSYKKKSYNPLFEDKRKTNSPEKKWIDVESSAAPGIAGSWTNPQQLNQIPNTPGPNSRVGAKATMVSIKFTAVNVFPSNAGISSPTQVRHLLVWDKQPNTGVAGKVDIIQDSTQSMSAVNLQNQERFVTIADVWSDPIPAFLGNTTTTIYRKLRLESIFQTGSSLTQTGALLYLCTCNADPTSSTTSNLPVSQFYSRIRFTDV